MRLQGRSMLPLSAAIAAAMALAACAWRDDGVPADVLLAARVATPPTLDGMADDAAWSAARPTRVTLTDGMNFADGKGASTGTLKAVVHGEHI